MCKDTNRLDDDARLAELEGGVRVDHLPLIRDEDRSGHGHRTVGESLEGAMAVLDEDADANDDDSFELGAEAGVTIPHVDIPRGKLDQDQAAMLTPPTAPPLDHVKPNNPMD